jgi:excisionase family DNA binding protein
MRSLDKPEWPPDAPLLLTYKQAGALLNCSKRTIENLVANGSLVRRKIGNLARIPRTSIEAFLRKDHVTAKPNEK